MALIEIFYNFRIRKVFNLLRLKDFNVVIEIIFNDIIIIYLIIKFIIRIIILIFIIIIRLPAII